MLFFFKYFLSAELEKLTIELGRKCFQDKKKNIVHELLICNHG